MALPRNFGLVVFLAIIIALALAFYLWQLKQQPAVNIPGGVLQFPQIAEQRDFAGQPAAELAEFIDPQAIDLKMQFLTYKDGTAGFYASYKLLNLTITDILQKDKISASINNWQILTTPAAGGGAALMEVQRTTGKTVFQAKIIYETAVPEGLSVKMQYQMSKAE